MPRITLIDPYGMGYRIDSRNPDTLRAWFDEVLPLVNHDSRFPSQINVHPMWRATENGALVDPDWSCDSRVIAGQWEFPALTGEQAMADLPKVREQLEHMARQREHQRRP